MTTTGENAKDIATAYSNAWLAGDAEKALSYIAEDIVCETPSGPVNGLAAYREFLTPFAGSVSNVHLLDVLAEGDHVGTFYRVDTPVATDYAGAERIIVENGKISHIISVFDMSPMMKAQAAAQGN